MDDRRLLRIQDIVAATVGPTFAVVAVDGGESYWHRRANGEDRLTMLLEELLTRLAKDGLGPGGADSPGRSSRGPRVPTSTPRSPLGRTGFNPLDTRPSR